MPARVLDDHVRFTYAAVEGEDDVTGVRLECDRAVPGPRELVPEGDGTWWVSLPRPDLQRLEYRFRVLRGHGDEVVLDPDNPRRVVTAFGHRSVLEMPGYRPPVWLGEPVVPGVRHHLRVVGETRPDVPVTLWTPREVDDAHPAPLLVVHDGPEYDRFASVTRFCAAGIASGRLPPHRVALFHPVLRDAWYSGSPRYLRTAVDAGLTQIGERYAVTGPVVVMGASLGGLTALLAGLVGAPRIGGVLAQSGSFFQVRHDAAERSFTYFDRISRLVQEVLDAPRAPHPLHVALTCGAHEENAANNADMAGALARAGHDVSYREVADLHNYTAWRDALHPSLTDLLFTTWDEGPR